MRKTSLPGDILKTSLPGDILKIQNTSLKLDFRNIRKTIEEDYIY